MKTRPTTVRGTPINRVGPTGVSVGKSDIAPGMPKGSDGQTTMKQFRGTGMDTKQSEKGTEYHSVAGNADEASRLASSGRYGVSPGAGGLDHNDPASNGDGVVFDGTSQDYASPKAAPLIDSPVPGKSPAVDTDKFVSVNEVRLGKGVDSSHARDDLLKIPDGVMSR